MHEDEIPIGRATDLRGKVFGRLTVLYRVKGRDNKRVYWKCRCECGNEVIVRGDSLTDKNYKHSCGCALRDHAIELGKSKKQDLLNQRFGMLTVIDKAPNGQCGRVKWKCQCDCGEIVEVFADNLRKGHSTSCGCLHNKTQVKPGAIYGKLTVIKQDENGYIKPNGRVEPKWICKCECGKEISVVQYNLVTGNTSSCGCNNSKGELFISKLLESHNILFIQQATFDSCRFKNTNALAKFDFYINNAYLVEFDGEQHFRPTGFYNSVEEFAKTVERDAYKNQWCKDNNIPLIRIPYTKLDTLCIEDLMLETTKFRVV